MQSMSYLMNSDFSMINLIFVASYGLVCLASIHQSIYLNKNKTTFVNICITRSIQFK